MCICKSPTDLRGKKQKKKRVADKDRTAHFCPYPACKKVWLHHECLDKNAKRILRTPQTELAANRPDVRRPDPTSPDPSLIDLSGLLLDDNYSGHHSQPSENLVERIERVAGQPILRTKREPFGNRRDVCLARVLLYHAREGGEESEDIDWKKVEALDMLRGNLPAPPVMCFKCIFCENAI